MGKKDRPKASDLLVQATPNQTADGTMATSSLSVGSSIEDDGSNANGGPFVDQESQQKLRRNLILDYNGPVTKIQIDAFKAVNQAEDDRYKLKKILAIWRFQQFGDKKLRGRSVFWIFMGMGFEILLSCFILISIGFGWMNFTDQWIPKTFFTGVFTEIVALMMIVVRNLFPQRKSDNLAEITEIIRKM